MKKHTTIIATFVCLAFLTNCTSSPQTKETKEEELEYAEVETFAEQEYTPETSIVNNEQNVATNEPKAIVTEQPPAKQESTPGEIIISMAKKHKIIGVWDLGGGSNGKRFATIFHDGRNWQYGILNVEDETLEDCDEPLKKINANTYKGYAAYDMPERLVINEAGNLDTYVYNPDMDEWVYMGTKVRIY